MKQIKKKLHSNTGASIMLALALTLICLMVSSVIVAAAASGAYRNQQELKSQQEYLAITSAAQYIAENLNTSRDFVFCGVHYNGEKVCNRYKSNYENNNRENIQINGENRSVFVIPTPTPYVAALAGVEVLDFYLVDGENIFHAARAEDKVGTGTSFSGIFKDMMNEAVESVYVEAKEYSKEFNVSVTDDRIPDVKCTFKMDMDYQVEIIVGSASGNSQYTLSVDLPAFSPIENPTGVKSNVECKHHCIYEYIDNVGNVAIKEDTELTFSHEVNNSTTTVTWGSPVINRGGSGL